MQYTIVFSFQETLPKQLTPGVPTIPCNCIKVEIITANIKQYQNVQMLQQCKLTSESK